MGLALTCYIATGIFQSSTSPRPYNIKLASAVRLATKQIKQLTDVGRY